MTMNLSGYDFIDFGASNGGSISWASGAFGGRGIGVDREPRKIAQLKSRGFDGFVADATSLELPEGSFRFATLVNFLEHLPDHATGARMLASAVHVCRDFVFVLGPDFDQLGYLQGLGFKKYFADWSGHTWHHRTADLAKILTELGYPFKLVQHSRIHDSLSRVIHPLAAQRNRGPYDPGMDPPKELVEFKQRVFSSVVAIVCKSPKVEVDDLLLRTLGLNVITGRPKPAVSGSTVDAAA